MREYTSSLIEPYPPHLDLQGPPFYQEERPIQIRVDGTMVEGYVLHRKADEVSVSMREPLNGFLRRERTTFMQVTGMPSFVGVYGDRVLEDLLYQCFLAARNKMD